MKRVIVFFFQITLVFSFHTIGWAGFFSSVPPLDLGAEGKQLSPKVLKLALDAYECAAASGANKQDILTIVDYSKPSTEKRLWVIDIPRHKVLFNSLVAHGKGSGELEATFFSNQPQTHASSLGVFLTGGVYQGRNGYSLRLYGLEENFNNNAAARAIVVHGAPYVTTDRADSGRMIGRSWGCPAVPNALARPIINTIKGGSIVFAYYPDRNWLKKSAYLHCPLAA